MRRAFKPYLRHPLSKRPAVERPDEPEIIEVTILPEWDAVLRYDGSPLMVEGTVTDTNGKTVVPGGLGNYNNQDSAGIDENGNEIDWIAIGLGTDNNPIDKFRSPNPIDDTVDPNDDITDGVVYTNTGPTRSVLSFNLEDIPPGAIIEEAFLELVPVTDKTTDDVWNEFDGENTNVWPSGGVKCEIQNLIRDTEETCTWNASSNATVSFNGVECPDQTKRWHNQPNSETLPNPIGAMQNSKRWDVQEGAELFSDQYIGSETIDKIDLNRTEKYGHVGYGAMGGGAVENVPDNRDQLPQFIISKSAHDEQMDGDTEVGGQVMPLIDVFRSVNYAHQNQAGRCNLLLRATHWEGVLDLDDDQTEETFAPPVLSLDSIILEDETDADNQVEIDHNAIIRFTPSTFDEDGNPNTDGDITWLDKAEDDGWDVTYDWQVKYPLITDFPGPNFEVTLKRGEIVQTVDLSGDPLQLLEGDVLSVRNMSSSGGFDNRHYFEFFVDDGDTSEDGGEQPQGIDQDFEITSGFIPEGDDSFTVGLRIGARARGANVPLNVGPAFPSAREDFLQIATIESEPDEIIDPTITIAFNPEITPDDDFGSPINLSTTHTITITTTISNIRPGFDWNNGSDGTTNFSNETTITAFKEGDFSDNYHLSISVQQFVDEDSRVATQEVQAQFTGQELLTGLSQTNEGDRFQIQMNTTFLDVGIDGNGSEYEDLEKRINENHTFQVSQVDTTNDFKITDPVGRRGVFTTTNLRGPLVNRRTISPQNTNLTQPDSFVKTNMFQRELAPCQLECAEGGNDSSAQTALLPIEERSRFSEITATKNKFALLDLTEGLQLIFDESDIRDTDGRIPVTQGNNSTVVSLVTSGGAGKMVERRRSGSSTPIFLPSDLAVYYYNDNEGEADIGWVYYRAVSKKLTPQPGTEDATRFRNLDTTDYTVDDFTVRNTDDGLEYIGWEKLSGDTNNLLQNIDINADDPNVGAHLFLLDDRYDFVVIPDLTDTNKWPVPYTEAFPLGRGVGGSNDPDPTELQARNNPSLLETFPEGEGLNALEGISSVLSVVEWKLGSLDSGTSNQENVNPSIVRTVLGAEQQPDSDGIGDVWNIPCPALPDTPETRDADNKLQPLPDTNSLFVCFDSIPDGISEPPDSPIEFKSYHAPGDGLGYIITGDNPTTGVDGVPTGRKLDIGSDEVDYCNAKSHFWNGHFFDLFSGALNEAFTGNENSGLRGRVPLFWRLAKDCGENNSGTIPGNRYFKEIDVDVTNVTSDLDRPLGANSPDFDGQGLIGYHGINIAYGQFHEDYFASQINNGNLGIASTPILEYIVEVIRGGSVYHRDIYRLANAQKAWDRERTVADNCFPCLANDFQDDITDGEGSCPEPSDASQRGEASIKSDTLYQVGIDGNEWKNGWYNPSDWRAGDIIRIYAIQPRIVGDELLLGSGFNIETYEVVEGAVTPDFDDQNHLREIPPTPKIQRIKKFCPVGEPWDCSVTYPPCCDENCFGQDGRLGVSRVCCQSGSVCVISCSIPGLGGGGGIDWRD